jgi:serine/threonine-protein kinase
LLQEARAAARIGHPAIVRISDFGKTPAGDPYLVMELLDGEDLSSALERRGRLNPLNAVRMLLPIAHALAAAHDKHIVHRDLKPENIYLSRSEDGSVQPKLIDFGVAKLGKTETSERITAVGVVVGSPGYMAPEQARGDDCDERADIWALCVVLYELVTGSLPFQGPNYNALLRAIIEDAAVPITEHGAGDEALWAILDRGLRKVPAARWESMRSLGQALSGWLMERGILEDVCGASLDATWHRTQTALDLDLPPPASRERTLSSPGRDDTGPVRISLRPSSDPPTSDPAPTSYSSPSSVPPPPTSFSSFESVPPPPASLSSLDAGPIESEPTAESATEARTVPPPRSRLGLFAGAVALVAVTAGATWLLTRPSEKPTVVVTPAEAPRAPGPPPAPPAVETPTVMAAPAPAPTAEPAATADPASMEAAAGTAPPATLQPPAERRRKPSTKFDTKDPGF